MSSVIGELGGIAGNAAGEALAFGLGFALGRVLDPAGTALSQEAWLAALSADSGLGRAVDPNTAALIVSEDVKARDWGANEAAQHGIDGARFDAIVGEILDAPGIPQLFEAWRRDLIDDAAFEHGLRKAKLEPRWDAPLKALKERLLSLDELANARQQGFVTPERQVAESALQGIDAERAEILFEIPGPPPGAAEAMQAVNRGLANRSLFDQMIREGHTKTKYSDLLYAMRRRLLTPHEYAELQLRGKIAPNERAAGASLSGMEPPDSELLYELLGRPLPVRAITTGLARGGTYGGIYEGVPEPYLDAIRRSAIRPEYGNLAYHNRYTYPSAFVLRALTQAHTITEQEAHQTLLDIGWEPGFAEKVATAWAGGTAAKADPHVAKAETQVWSALHKSYVDTEEDDATATGDLTALGVAAPAIPEVLRLWQLERAVIRRSLTPAQIRKAVGQPGKDHAWALARLSELGYTTDDATTFLAE